ncbi:dienelactone hydrolase [Luteibacter sp. Sphag1AF]|uniref:serine aminopeptidase domain-containing protein n=1 Tax=Luteibacter sp. Sphag1AF TaxID=2587031 RepID=UPI001612E29F|nr:alpha/beta hydrolase [Luteibacter sp. Sphag1AF]MBB3228567.1 dienelactone hydrolase [Luteibacter sp. Sphag1AF]
MSTGALKEMPRFFGANRELFGLFHPGAPDAPHAVLLCPPLGQDQIRCHRLYRQLAQALAAEGVPALRFDYYGSGDSAGDSAGLDWNRCVDDAMEAANELRRHSGVDRVVAFGARLGASIAITAATEARFAGIVAWDPVLEGGSHVARLDALQEALRTDSSRFMASRTAADIAGQWQGFAISDRLRRQLLELYVEPPAVPLLVVDTQPDRVARSWRHTVGDEAQVVRLQSATPWDELERMEVAILSQPVIRAVTGHLKEVAHA